MVAGELGVAIELGDQVQAALDLAGHGERYRAVQLDHGRRMHAREDRVERGDLTPVRGRGAGRLRVDGRDGRLQGVSSGGAATLAQSGLHEADALADLRAIPPASILHLPE